MKGQSLIKQIVIGVTISLLSAFLIYKFGWNQSPQPAVSKNVPRANENKEHSGKESNENELPTSTIQIEIDWTNLKEYFVVKKPTMSHGFGKAPSILQVVLAPKGNFGGVLQAFAFDEDDVRVCSFSGNEVGLFDSGCISYDLNVMLQSSTFQDSYDLFGDSDPRLHFWKKGISERASISIPHNAVRLHFYFNQQH